MNIDGTGFHTCKECHKNGSLWNHTITDHKEGEQLEDRRSVGASSCNSGDGTDQRVQSLMFMLMMMTLIIKDLRNLVMYHFGTPWGWHKCIETCRSDYNTNIVKLKTIYCALLFEIKTINYYVYKVCVRNCSEEEIFYRFVWCTRETEIVRAVIQFWIYWHFVTLTEIKIYRVSKH